MLANRASGPVSADLVAQIVARYAATGQPIAGDVVNGALVPLSPEQIAVVRNTYLTQLGPLETAIVGAAVRLSTESAAVWKRNANEVRDRERLFRSWRLRLCWFLGIESGPFLDEMLPAAFIV